MPGPAPKRDADRSAKAKAPAKTTIDVEVLPALAGASAPAPPSGLPAEVVAEWDDLWASPLAATIATTDLPALRRLFSLRARHALLLAGVDTDDMLTVGSKGQLVLHPSLGAAKELEPAICALEDRFGLSVRARQSLGIRMGALADVAKRHPELAAPQEDRPRADPRVADAAPAPAQPRRRGRRLDGGEPPPQRGRPRG